MEHNRRLEKIRDKIKNIYNAFPNIHNGQDPKPEKFKILVDKELKGLSGQEHKTFIAFFEELYKASLDGSRVQHKTGESFARNTIKSYLTAINHLKVFEQTRKKRLDFEDITIEFHSDFIECLIKKYKLGPNTIGVEMKVIKMVMNKAMERGFHKNLQYKSRRFSVAKEIADTIYLNQTELDEMLKVNLSVNGRLERVLDLFIVGCYTGLRFSDLSTLRPGHILQTKIIV